VSKSSAPFNRIEISDSALECSNLRHLTFHSSALDGRGDVSFFVPQGILFPRDIPLVLLLHGVYGSHWAWFFKGAAHRTAQDLIDRKVIRPMIIATPSDGLSGDGSCYLPRPNRDVESWIARDVPECIRELLPSRGPNFLSGLSMGGYGALRLGFKYPERFAGISAHSSIVKIEQMYDFAPGSELGLQEMDDEEHDILFWANLNSSSLPPVRFDCGRDDPLYVANIELSHKLTAIGIPHLFESYDGGHTWDYWRDHFADTLRFFDSLLP
jgi:putative tributyrin esterase